MPPWCMAGQHYGSIIHGDLDPLRRDSAKLPNRIVDFVARFRVVDLSLQIDCESIADIAHSTCRAGDSVLPRIPDAPCERRHAARTAK